MSGYEALAAVAIVLVIAVTFIIVALNKEEVAAEVTVPGKGSLSLRAKDPRRRRKANPTQSRAQLPPRSDEP